VLDIDGLVADLQVAARETEPVLAVRDVLDRVLADVDTVREALPPTRAELTSLHTSDELTVLKLVWAPGMWLQPHDHRMWAAIGIYGGQEDNTFYRRVGDGRRDRVAPVGGKEMRPGDVTLLGDDVIHSVQNPLTTCTGAIHVYGGNFFTRDRSDWARESLEPTSAPPDDYFEEWNRSLGL
jgi:predicted metal-dependent enzyme (double-stranded beta helix superfamily)